MSEIALKDQEQKAAEAEVEADQDETSPFVIAAETTRMAMVFTDAKAAGHPIIFANDSFLKLTGYDRDEVMAQSFDFLLASPDDDGTLREIKSCFEPGSDDSPDIRYRRKDGSEFWASLFVNAVKDEQGEVVQHFSSLVDTTRYKTAQQHAALLIDELNHRVKNTLATVQSIVAQAMRGVSDPAVIRESIETRIAALSRAHDLLGRAKWDGAGLHDLACKALAPFSVADDHTDRITIEGENIRLSPKAVLALGIAFNELATNAVKYGALSVPEGTIQIEWRIDPTDVGDSISLEWIESGGPPVAAPKRTGQGMRFIEGSIAHELKGKADIAFDPTGLRAILTFPLTAAIQPDDNRMSEPASA